MLVRPMEIAEVLGGPAVLGRTVRDFGDLDEVVRAGLPFGALDALEARLPATGGRRTSPVRSVVRRRSRGAGLTVLAPAEGERAGRVARLFAMATKVFGSPQGAAEFLTTPHSRLDDRTPLECLLTDIGGREVEEILNAIAYGLPA